ncbi:MAG: hypothetical protein AAGC55_06780 [Myxococcota bacterium]
MKTALHVRSFLLGLGFAGAFILGCMTSSLAPQSVVLPADAQSPAAKVAWNQDCYATTDYNQLRDTVKNNGRAGWELISTGVGGAPGGFRYIVCFKRPL